MFCNSNNLPLPDLPISLLCQIISRGKIVKFASEKRLQGTGSQAISFTVTSDMVPSIRLLVYYILHGEKTPELVADSVWIDVKDKCVNALKVL